jgi:ribosomal protein L24
MRQKILLLSLSMFLGIFSFVSAQTPETGARPSVVTGDVTGLSAGKIVLQTKDGSMDVLLTEKTEFKRVAPDNPKLSAATPANLSDIGVGDKLVVSGVVAADKKSVPARTVFLMTKSDIAQKQAKEGEQWRTRGVAGKVVSVNPQTNQITVEVRGLANTTSVILTPKANAVFRRYAPGSVRYSDAKTSSVGEIKAGDMLRALGDKSADGATFAAEEVLTGAFQTVAGTVKTIDAATGEVVISDFQTKKDITITVVSATTLKKFPEEMAQRMAQMQTMQAAGGVRPQGQGQGGAGGMRPPQSGGAPGSENPGGQARGGFGGGMRGAQGGIDDMLERFPNITVADLKAGDMIAVSSMKTANADRLTAIKLLAGVEPFLRAAQASGGNNGGQRGGGQGNFNIPGLDGADFP